MRWDAQCLGGVPVMEVSAHTHVHTHVRTVHKPPPPARARPRPGRVCGKPLWGRCCLGSSSSGQHVGRARRSAFRRHGHLYRRCTEWGPAGVSPGEGQPAWGSVQRAASNGSLLWRGEDPSSLVHLASLQCSWPTRTAGQKTVHSADWC